MSHKRYWNMGRRRCGCKYHLGLDGCSVSRAATEVMFTCNGCGGIAARYYRSSEVDDKPAKATLGVGTKVSAERYIAWIGYAVNPDTYPIEHEGLLRKMTELIRTVTGPEVEVVWNARQLTLWDQPWYITRFKQVVEGHAKYCILEEAYRKGPRFRGIWFRDEPWEGEIVDRVRCVTGQRDSGSYDEGPSLYEVGHHVLYVVGDGYGYHRLIYPGDVDNGS